MKKITDLDGAASATIQPFAPSGAHSYRAERSIQMSKLINPALFSQHFPATSADFANCGLLEPILNADTKLFIDPLLLSSSANDLIREDAFDLLTKRFEKIIRLIAASRGLGDKAWRTAAQLLDIGERPETGLGYGGASTSGSSRPETVRAQILSTAKEIIELGEH